MNAAWRCAARKTIRFLSENDKAVLVFLAKVYREADTRVNRFKRATGLRCVRGCGQCCQTGYVETTALEMLPLAVELWRRRHAEYWLEKASAARLEGQCIFYMPDGNGKGRGCCAVYPFRPLICRLFGFTAHRDKRGQPSLLACSFIHTAARAHALRRRANMASAPLMSDFTTRIIAFGHDAARTRLPINEAAANAIERIGLAMEMKGAFGRKPPSLPAVQPAPLPARG